MSMSLQLFFQLDENNISIDQGWIKFKKSSPADKIGFNWRKLDKSGENWRKLILTIEGECKGQVF